MKKIVYLIALFTVFPSFASDNVDTLAEQHLKAEGGKEEAPVKADPASGFWSCNGIRLFMAPDLLSWTNLDDGTLSTIIEKGSIDDSDKDEKVKGTDYLYRWTPNPAVITYFIVDKSGKNLYVRDAIKFYKTYRCKRA